jgi:hypothetical protein
VARRKRLNLPIEYQLCRGPGRHQWELSTPPPGNKRGTSFGYLQYWLCVRCGNQRFDTINSLGRLAQRGYEPPEGYSFAKGEAPTTAEINLSLALEYDIPFNGMEPVDKRKAAREAAKADAPERVSGAVKRRKPERPPARKTKTKERRLRAVG